MMVTGRSCLILNEELVLWDLLNERIAREFTVYSGASRFVEKGVIAYSFETRHVEVFSIVDNRAYNCLPNAVETISRYCRGEYSSTNKMKLMRVWQEGFSDTQYKMTNLCSCFQMLKDSRKIGLFLSFADFATVSNLPLRPPLHQNFGRCKHQLRQII